MEDHAVLFREEQRFRQWWFWLLILAGVSPSWYLWWMEIVLDRRVVNGDEMPDWAIWLMWLGVGIFLPLLFASMRLITVVKPDGLYVRFVPFHWKWVKIPLQEVRSVKARRYNPIAEYGGWGIRYGRRGKAYNVSGNWGVELEFASGRTLLIGSQRAEELERIIHEVM